MKHKVMEILLIGNTKEEILKSLNDLKEELEKDHCENNILADTFEYDLWEYESNDSFACKGALYHAMTNSKYTSWHFDQEH